ncbi:hypothetical protein LCGC14_1967250, partial [marine sediment metagenome]
DTRNEIIKKVIGLGVDRSKIKIIRLNEINQCCAIRLAYKVLR